MSNTTSFHRELARRILSFPRDESQPSESHVLIIADILAKSFLDLTGRYARYQELENVAQPASSTPAGETRISHDTMDLIEAKQKEVESLKMKLTSLIEERDKLKEEINNLVLIIAGLNSLNDAINADCDRLAKALEAHQKAKARLASDDFCCDDETRILFDQASNLSREALAIHNIRKNAK